MFETALLVLLYSSISHFIEVNNVNNINAGSCDNDLPIL